MAFIHDLGLTKEEKKELEDKIMSFFDRNAWECYGTDVITEPEIPGTTEMMVYGSQGTTLRCVKSEGKWTVNKDDVWK